MDWGNQRAYEQGGLCDHCGARLDIEYGEAWCTNPSCPGQESEYDQIITASSVYNNGGNDE